MFFTEFIIAFAFAALVVILFTLVLGRGGPWEGILWFFLVVFLGAWAVGAWADPVGPAVVGVAWLPFLVAAVAVGLLLAALSGPVRGSAPAQSSLEERNRATMDVGALFWVFLTLLVVLIVFASLGGL